jgi:hypothetical protein
LDGDTHLRCHPNTIPNRNPSTHYDANRNPYTYHDANRHAVTRFHSDVDTYSDKYANYYSRRAGDIRANPNPNV